MPRSNFDIRIFNDSVVQCEVRSVAETRVIDTVRVSYVFDTNKLIADTLRTGITDIQEALKYTRKHHPEMFAH